MIQQLINQGVKKELIQEMDEIYTRNQVMALLQLDEFIEHEAGAEESIPSLLEKLVNYACEQEIIEDIFDEREIFSARLINVFLSKPSEVNRIFAEKYERNPREATEYFYELSKNTNYIQMNRIAKNISYKAETEYGDLDITINLSKPEKDPKAIAKQKEIKSTNYPKCLLCMENEGYAGRIGSPARSNHRVVRMELEGEKWALQYSPYVYYNEHCIVLSEEHRDMMMNKVAFTRLLAFVEKFPHYFVGSNADLPIVGGSILSHDHYQGGNYEFAMAKAVDEHEFTIPSFKNVTATTIKWPMSVIRLRSQNTSELTEAAEYILEKWRGYSDEEVEILSHTDETPHNTVTPIARKKNGLFEMDLVLRNNRTNAEHPLGIFHPHDDVHHIKKENIGLIEVMGLAVLPARLKEELKEVGKYILEQPNEIMEYHRRWADDIKGSAREIITTENVEGVIRSEVAKKFSKVLEDAGVYKRDEQGQKAFQRFIKTL